MNFLKTLFFGKEKDDVLYLPLAKFGRFSDSYKTSDQKVDWDKSLKAFGEKRFLDAFEYLFSYLVNATQPNNIQWARVKMENKEVLQFTIIQGSKAITGWAGIDRFSSICSIAKSKNEMPIGLIRKLLEENNILRYCKYGLDDDQCIVMKFDSSTIDANPYKVYFGLKELASVSDRMDDSARFIFQDLELIGHDQKTEYSAAIISIKFNYLQKLLNNALDIYGKNEFEIDQNHQLGGYIFLHFSYLIDYLIQPEGYIADSIEQIHDIYHNSPEITGDEKNKRARKTFHKLLEISMMDFGKEIYQANHTFGLPVAAGLDDFKNILQVEINNYKTLIQKGQYGMAQVVMNYIFTFCLFNHAFQKPVMECLQLWVNNQEREYFIALGEKIQWFADGQKIDLKILKNQLQRIESSNKTFFSELMIPVKDISSNDPMNLTQQFLQMMHNIIL